MLPHVLSISQLCRAGAGIQASEHFVVPIECPNMSYLMFRLYRPGAGIQASGHFLTLIDCPNMSHLMF